MNQTSIRSWDFSYDVVVVGTGAAGYSAACRITEEQKKSVCIVTEGVLAGTSRNTGSDKQTYYKLGLGGDAPDSVRAMTETLFAGGCTDGDNALCEAALSSRCFFRLAEGGVPFPQNRYGEFVGYKTDHDPFARATSAGPLTSKFMTEVLEKQATALNIPIHDGLLAVEVLQNENGICGLMCLDIKTGNHVVFRCANVVLATGGPAGIYADTVYPISHHGSTGLAVRAGASLQNLTEWQYGLASTNPRWNVSGTYMQVLPRFVSVDADGNEYEFLLEYFGDPYKALSEVFLKGYQWPFDIKKAYDGSSVVDLLVFREAVLRNRRVYLDFMKNPFGLTEIDYTALSEEAYDYLRKAEATFGTPIERLSKMNHPAITLYESKGVDITKEYLEIALCAQHHNGGISVDLWWQTKVKGLFAIGECAGTHGITRPGGSALNAGQVGALRASQYISASDRVLYDDDSANAVITAALEKHRALCSTAFKNNNNADEALKTATEKMSACAAAIRNVKEIDLYREEAALALKEFSSRYGVAAPSEAYKLYFLLDTLTVQQAVLAAMSDYAKTIPSSRGSALYTDTNGTLPEGGLEEIFRFTYKEEKTARDRIQELSVNENGTPSVCWRSVRPIPSCDDVFETVWRTYRENKNIF